MLLKILNMGGFFSIITIVSLLQFTEIQETLLPHLL